MRSRFPANREGGGGYTSVYILRNQAWLDSIAHIFKRRKGKVPETFFQNRLQLDKQLPQ